MPNLKYIRDNNISYIKTLKARNFEEAEDFIEKILSLDEENRHLINILESSKHEKNLHTSEIGRLKARKEEISSELIDKINFITKDIEEKTDQLSIISKRLQEKLDLLPNILQDDVPIGDDEESNKIIKTRGEKPKIDNPIAHDDIGVMLGQMDFKQTSIISGSRFVTLKSDLASLERALINFMIDENKKRGYMEISVPSLVKSEAMYNTGQLPKFAEDSFLADDKYRLIPTGEVPITNMVANNILKENDLPIRYVGYTPCYRSEAGSAGRDTKGMIRMHQFGKVELVTIAHPSESCDEHEYMLETALNLLDKLEISYRVCVLCSGDTGFSASKTYDIEVWLPSSKNYREISSVSNCLDFQARRMKARYKDVKNKKNIFVHTLNGSALAVGRTIVAILENYQNADGSITIPNVLRNYMGGATKITKSF